MIQNECREMPAGRPTRDHYGSLNTVLGALRVEPVERCSQLVRDLGQARLRSKGVARRYVKFSNDINGGILPNGE